MVGYTTGNFQISKKKLIISWLDINCPMAAKKTSDSRHGKLSENTSQTSITMNKKLMEMAKAEAKKEGRSLSNWLEQLVKKGLPPLLLTFALFHLGG
jgi:siderophore synthetase component